MNHLDELVHDWGWWNRAYTRLLIRARGYRLASIVKVLPRVETAAELTQHPVGAWMPLQSRISFHDLPPPLVALGEHADYVVQYYKREFAPREDRPFIAYFHNPLLYGRQFSIIDSQRRIFEECFIRDRRWREGVPKTKAKAEGKKVSGTFLLAGAEFHNHYAHLFCDVLPRLKLYEEAGLAGNVPPLLPPPSQGFAEEAWNRLGYARESLRWDDTCWQLDGLYFASSFKKFCSWTVESARWIRQKLAPGIEQKSPGSKIFYVTRRGGPRSIQNEDEILQGLAAFNVTVVQAETLSLQQQIDLFSEAALVLGPHGAGIQNALWAPPGCRVLELVNARYFSGIYWTLASSLSQPYGLVAGASVTGGNPLKESYSCPADLVKQAVEQLLAAR